MLTREAIHYARRRFVLDNRGDEPDFLFLSLDAHTQLLLQLRSTPEWNAMTSLQGARFMGMDIHVVPTLLGREFKVA